MYVHRLDTSVLNAGVLKRKSSLFRELTKKLFCGESRVVKIKIEGGADRRVSFFFFFRQSGQ